MKIKFSKDCDAFKQWGKKMESVTQTINGKKLKLEQAPVLLLSCEPHSVEGPDYVLQVLQR